MPVPRAASPRREMPLCNTRQGKIPHSSPARDSRADSPRLFLRRSSTAHFGWCVLLLLTPGGEDLRYCPLCGCCPGAGRGSEDGGTILLIRIVVTRFP